MRRPVVFFCAVMMIATMDIGASAESGTSSQSTAVVCHVAGGSGVSETRAPQGGSAAGKGKPAITTWVMADDGIDVGDRIDLFWHRPADAHASLRIALDGPVSKPTHLLSITDDTVSAVAVTSDQDTTRTWMFTINFHLKHVVASGIVSNKSQTKGQLILLTCEFRANGGDEPLAHASDHWQRE